MNDFMIYKIKDSVDLFLSDNKYIMAYYMNTRQRKSFRVNEGVVHLLENIDGERTLGELKREMQCSYDILSADIEAVIGLMIKNRIVTEVNKNNHILDSYNLDRYARQINYFSEFLGSEEAGIKSQEKLMNTSVLVFGCGAVGGDIALELVMAGVKRIVLYDFDVVEKSDVSRHMYFKEEYVGRKKVDVLAEKLREIDGKVMVTIFDMSMKPESEIESIISHSDFVVNTLDEPYIGYTSSKISRICVKHNIPHFIGGGFDAHLASTGELIIPYVTPCVECYSTHFKVKLKGWKPKKHPVKTRYMEIGGLSSMSLFSASYASIEIIKQIAGLTDMTDTFKVRGELLFNDMSLTYLNVKKNLECPICGGGSIYES